MALIKCPECKESISDAAISCPKCGYPLQKKRYEQKLLFEKKLEMERKEKGFISSLHSTGILRNHEYVDLGLPSRTLWATCNIGAKSIMDWGNFYTWGSIDSNSNGCFVYDNGSGPDYSKFTKYNNLDKRRILDSIDDVAVTEWGGGWRMPTKEEFYELRANCKMTLWQEKWKETMYGNTFSVEGFIGNGGVGYTGLNDKSIFMPFSFYWSSTLMNEWTAYGLDHDDISKSPKDFRMRICAGQIRPVCKQ